MSICDPSDTTETAGSGVIVTWNALGCSGPWRSQEVTDTDVENYRGTVESVLKTLFKLKFTV